VPVVDEFVREWHFGEGSRCQVPGTGFGLRFHRHLTPETWHLLSPDLTHERAEHVDQPHFVVEPGARMVFRDGAVKRVATLAAVQFDVLPNLLQRLLIRGVPAFEVPAAALALLALHLRGSLSGLSFLHLDLNCAQLTAPPSTTARVSSR